MHRKKHSSKQFHLQGINFPCKLTLQTEYMHFVLVLSMKVLHILSIMKYPYNNSLQT